MDPKNESKSMAKGGAAPKEEAGASAGADAAAAAAGGTTDPATVAPVVPAGDQVTLSRSELQSMLDETANRAAAAAVAAMPPAVKETVVMRSEPKRDQEEEVQKINANNAAKLADKEELLKQGFHRFVCRAASQPRLNKFVCAGVEGMSVTDAMLIAIGKYSAYSGIIATLEVDKQVKAEYIGLASEEEPAMA